MKSILAILLLNGLLLASSFQEGKAIYEKTCLSCHGVDGRADTGINFIVNPRSLQTTILNEEQTYQIIKKGAHFHGAASDIMPSFESVYNEKELRAVTHYITKAFNTDSEQRVKELYAQSDSIEESRKAKMLKRGAKIYKRNCSWCHGMTGDGNGEATRNPEMSIFPYNLTKSLLSSEQEFLYIKYGGKYWGTAKEDMPAWKKKYDDYTIKSVVKYIQEEIKVKQNVK